MGQRVQCNTNPSRTLLVSYDWSTAISQPNRWQRYGRLAPRNAAMQAAGSSDEAFMQLEIGLEL